MFRELIWRPFISNCRPLSGSARNPWAAWGDKAKEAHANGAGGRVLAAPPAAATSTPKKRVCTQQCKDKLNAVLADEYCLQRFEESSADQGDVGATSLLADALVMCDLTRPSPPPKFSQPDAASIGMAAPNAGALVSPLLVVMMVVPMASTLLAAAAGML